MFSQIILLHDSNIRGIAKINDIYVFFNSRLIIKLN